MAIAKTSAILIAGTPFVNLIPPSETARRDGVKLLRRWIAALVAVIAVVAIATAGAFWLQLTAAQRLLAENLRTQELLSQMAELSDVQAQLDLQSELTTFRSEAMATDLRFDGLVDAIGATLPGGAEIAGFSLAPAGAPQGEDPAAEIGAAGTVTIASAGPQEVVPIVRAVRGLAGVMEADGWVVQSAEGGYTYELRVVFDQSVYTGAYKEAE
ncbi:hypothetical protein [Microbacterium sulfonylureivorans]|uniref:hypothetical protein n=1 Tax=Microbacterium sulfonylureivorans TaxID=2486854 RepID=UPI000FD89568|nr:hypothetical protein [Microbacterium sulfonylureivorans]